MSDGTNSARAPAIVALIRRVVPLLLIPLSLVGCALASSPWLRAFPSSVLAVPLFGAALLSVLLPVVVIGIGIRTLWLTALIDLVGFAFFAMLVALREPAGFADLYTGLVHGPSQILTFALPLVSPRTLLVAPVALCWLSGAIVGECIGRGWQSVVPYATLMVTFGLSYAGTARAITSASDGRRYDTLLAALLLLTLLLLRAAQAWVEQDEGAESTQPEGILPLRGLAVGTVVSVAVAAAAAAAVQSSAFHGSAATPARTPPIDRSQPLTPVSFVSALRPRNPRSKGSPLFRVTLDRRASNYIALADVDYYDGDGWTFSAGRTFRPSGGVIPSDDDPAMRTRGPAVAQQYTIDKGPLTTVPWMPFQYRPQKVTGAAVDIDTASGMVAPSSRLRTNTHYTVRSTAVPRDFEKLSKTAVIGSSRRQSDLLLPPAVSQSIGTVVTSLQDETHSTGAPPLQFLQALETDLRTKYALSGARSTAGATPAATSTTPRSSTSATKPPAGHPTKHASKHPKKHGAHFAADAPTPSSPNASPTPSATTGTGASPAGGGGTSFASVLASILGPGRSATPAQYATLVALVARQLGVPARVVAGFRIPPSGGASTVPAGTYTVTTGEAWTWVEVPVRGQGWVVVDAAPSALSAQKPTPSASVRPTPTQSPTPTQNALVTANPNGHAAAPKSRVPHSHGTSGTAIALIVITGAIALLVLLVLVLLLRKRLRVRRRKGPGDPRRRLLGAWQESLDVLIESGLPELTTLSSAEVAAVTGEQFGGESAAQVRYIGDSANAAIFSPTSWVAPGEADAVWRAQTVLRKSLRRRQTLRERMGSGLRYHRPVRTRPLVGPSSWAAVARSRAASQRPRAKHSARRRRRGH